MVTSTRWPFVDPAVDRLDEVVDLALGRLDDDLGVDQAGRAHDLLDHPTLGLLDLVGRRGGRQEDALVDALVELVEAQRPVVGGRRQPEAVVDERLLAGAVALVLAVQLRHGDVGLVDDEQVVVGEVVEQRVGRLARLPAVDVHRVVLDAVAEADLLHHLEVVLRAHAQALGLEQLALLLEPGQALLQLHLDVDDGALHALLAGGVVRGREDREVVDLAQVLAGDEVDAADALDVVAEELDAHRVLLVRGVHLDGVAPDAELAPHEVHVVALVLHVDELREDVALVVAGAHLQPQDLALVLLGGAEAVDARHRGHDDDVAPAQQARGGRVAQAVDLVVDRRVLLDVRVARRDVGLGLVVVVVGDEVLDPVLGEELAELVGELRGERLVGRDHERRSLHLLDGPGDGGALAAAGDAEQRLEPVAPLDALGQGLDGPSGWSPAGAKSETTLNGGIPADATEGVRQRLSATRRRREGRAQLPVPSEPPKPLNGSDGRSRAGRRRRSTPSAMSARRSAYSTRLAPRSLWVARTQTVPDETNHDCLLSPVPARSGVRISFGIAREESE